MLNYFFKYLLLLTFMLIPLANASELAPANISALAQKKLAKLETSFNGKIGVYAINTNNNQIIAYRADERFPVQSTLKLMAVAALLKLSESNQDLLKEKINYTKKDLMSWSPVTSKYVTTGMTLEAMAEAAISYSDNPSINLILKKFGGPKFSTDFAHSIGNKTYNLADYDGADLNSNPSKETDTSTPRDMAISVQKLLLGSILAQPQRTQLITWMRNNTTGYKRIRAGVPSAWTVADKTGSGNYGIANDIGMVWSPSCKPIVLAIYTAHNKRDAPVRDDIVAATTTIVLDEFAKYDACFKVGQL